MRVLNDKEEKIEPSEVGALAVVTHAMMCALGIASVVFAPLPMIVAGVRLEEPWPKVSAIAGAVLSLLLFNVEPAIAVMAFIFGVFVADAVRREVKFWPLLGQAGSVAILVSFVALIVSAQWERVTPLERWLSLADGIVTQLQAVVKLEDPAQWEALRAMLTYEGAFLLLSSVFISLWLSLGLAAHMGWLGGNTTYSGEGLRSIRVPLWTVGAFLVLFLGVNAEALAQHHWLDGLYRLVATLMFIQGCVCISEALSRRSIGARVRTLIYSVLVILGFPLLVGIGVLSPWFFKKTVRLNQRLEEAI